MSSTKKDGHKSWYNNYAVNQSTKEKGELKI